MRVGTYQVRFVRQRSWIAVAAAIAAALAAARSDAWAAQSPFAEESADVFLAKATLQQYLSREVRKDRDGMRRLTHPKALSRDASRAARLAPWEGDGELKTFAFRGAREVAAGIVAVEVGEERSTNGQHDNAADVPALYLLVKARGGFRVAERRAGAELADVHDKPIVASYASWVDAQTRPQARRPASARKPRHR
jgi:hypothetical protein